MAGGAAVTPETHETIEVCVCTFRRPSIGETLRSIAAQVLPAGIRLRAIVADNDATPSARDTIQDAARELSLDVRYVHAPVQNISVARNACLAAASADWLAFIDDDEEAAPGWLASLLERREGADVLFGVSQARYPDPRTPAWVVAGDFHSNRLAGNDAAWNGYTANVMIDRRFVVRHKLTFNLAFGRTGGEDTRFFFDAFNAGARFGYVPDAIVWEDTPLRRADFRWLALRRFRSGQIHFLLRGRAGRYRLAATALIKAAVCMAGAASRPWSPLAARRSALRGMLHLGVVASYLGLSPYQEYAQPPTA